VVRRPDIAMAKRKRKPQTTAIVPGKDSPTREYGLKLEQIDLIRSTICKNATNEELRLFLWVAKRHKLDPLTRQLHAVKRYVKKHHQDEKGIWCEGETMTIQVGIDGYRAMAARYKDYGGIDEPEYEYANKGDKVPVLARVRVWKKGFDHPTVGLAYWDEYAPSDVNADKSFMWKKMPRLMLAKCAEALALRKAYPELSDIYTDEEMDQVDQDFTASGRQIVDQNGFAPSGRAVTHEAARAGSHEAAQETARRKIAELQEPKAKPEEKPAMPPQESQQHVNVQIDHTDEASPIIRGDLQDLLPLLQKHCAMKWEGDWWHIAPRDAETVREMSRQMGFRLTEVMPKQAPDKAMSGKAGAAAPPSARPSAPPPRSEPAAPAKEEGTASGTIERVFASAGAHPKLVVTLVVPGGKKLTYSCFRKSLWDEIQKGVGKLAVFTVTKNKDYVNIEDIRTLAGREYVDGKPVLQQKDREAGGRTLF
jgi:phage recombination protein Bet